MSANFLEIAKILRNLNPDDIRARLRELDHEQKALRVLLRAAIHRPGAGPEEQVTLGRKGKKS